MNQISTLEPTIDLVRTDDLSRHPESQIRASADAGLVAEYAEAMLEGAVFPPVVVYRDSAGLKYLADGHHRVDAAALAALKDKRFKAEIRAEIRPGTMEDALRHAMQANRLHGKRMTDADYKRAIGMAFDHDLIKAETARDVIAEIVALVGCSVRTAQVYSSDRRQEMIAKRNRLIVAMHRDGKTQEMIGTKLGISRQAVSKIIDRIATKRSAAESSKTRQPPPRAAVMIAADDDDDDLEAAEPSATPAPVQPAKPASKSSYRIDVSPYLPLLEKLRPIDEGGDDLESGSVGTLADVAEDDSEIKEDPAALRAIARLTNTLKKTIEALDGKLDDLAKPYRPKSADPAVDQIERTLDFLDELKNYLTEGDDA